MKIFNLEIITKREKHRVILECFNKGWNTHAKTVNQVLREAIRDLESLRADTWNQDKITKLQNWLRGGIDE